jgi:hypothetical protein
MTRLILSLVFFFVISFDTDVTHAQNTQTLRGYVSSVDDFNGTITLSPDPIPLGPTAELFESQCGGQAQVIDRDWAILFRHTRGLRLDRIRGSGQQESLTGLGKGSCH